MTLAGDATKGAGELAKTAPHWVCLILVVGGFLYYLDREHNRDVAAAKLHEVVAVQRIDNCHKVQQEGIDVMARLEQTLEKQAAAFDNFVRVLSQPKENGQ